MMSQSSSLFAYNDVRDAFERALQSPHGIKITYSSYSQAIHERSRFNQFRKLHRAETLDIYDEGHPLRGKSVYEALNLRIPRRSEPDSNILYIEPRTIANMQIEDL